MEVEILTTKQKKRHDYYFKKKHGYARSRVIDNDFDEYMISKGYTLCMDKYGYRTYESIKDDFNNI
jgi:hypothetical protein